MPTSLSTLVAKLVVTSDALALVASAEVTSFAFALVANALCVAVEIGFAASEVLSTLPKPRLVRAAAAVVAPVPPPAMDRVSLNLDAVSAKRAKGL